MTSQSHVTAVVVTFNRSGTLALCLEALRCQTRRPDTVLIVDNASVDDTAEVIASAVARDGFLKVEVLALKENTGGAGGFDAGMRRALELNCDWVWTMDDDVAPDANCLEILLDHTGVSECVHPQRFKVDGSPQAWEPVVSVATGTSTFLDNLSFSNGKEVTFTNVACFEGALVSRRIIELVGFPDPSFFVVGDDTVFGLKASVHTNVAIARDAHMRRLLPITSFAPWKVYYLTRNAFMVRSQACAYLAVTPTRVQRIVFVLNLVLETSRHARRGPTFIGPVLRGFRDGIAYSHGYSARPTRGLGRQCAADAADRASRS